MNTKNKETETQIQKNISAQLRHTRLLSSITQKDLARKVGVTYQQIQKYENGKSRISAVKLYRLLNALNVPYEEFFKATPKEKERNETYDSTLKICARLMAVEDLVLRQKIKDAIYCLTS